jgi:hypothetical protein
MIGAIPQVVIEMPEKAARSGLPRPPEVKTHLAQRFERHWQNGSHVVSLKIWHAQFL